MTYKTIEEQKKAIYDIIAKHIETLDILASYQHYMVFGEVKLIEKDKK